MNLPVFLLGWRRLALSTRLGSIISLLLLAGLLQSCSVMKIAYGQASELVYWQLDGYLDFNQMQSPGIRQALAKTHTWHRETQLPLYVQALQKWQTWLPGDVTQDQTCEIFSVAREEMQAIVYHGEAALAPLMSKLEPDQIEHLKRKFSELNTEYRADFIDADARSVLEKRLKKTVKHAEMLYGPLEAPQLEVLGRELAQSVFNPAIMLAEYQRRQQDILQTLSPLIAKQATPEQAHTVLRAYVSRSLTSPDPVFRDYQQKRMQSNCKIFTSLHNSTTPAQRRQAIQTVATYMQDFNILVARR